MGDTNLPTAPLAAGSQTAASVGSATVIVAAQLRDRLAALGAGGKVPAEGITIDVSAKVDEAAEERYAQQAFGAHFAEVEVDPDLYSIRVTRFVGAYDVGRVLNAKTAGSQLVGAVVWGIGMALYEKTRFDLRTGRIMNATLADYLVPTNADIPNPDVITVEDDDERVIWWACAGWARSRCVDPPQQSRTRSTTRPAFAYANCRSPWKHCSDDAHRRARPSLQHRRQTETDGDADRRVDA